MLRLHLRRYEPSWTGGGHGRPLKQPVQLAGAAPIEASSGRVVRHRLNHSGASRLPKRAAVRRGASVAPETYHPDEPQ